MVEDMPDPHAIGWREGQIHSAQSIPQMIEEL